MSDSTTTTSVYTSSTSATSLVLPDAVSSSDYPAASDISSSTMKPSVQLYSNLPLDLSLHTHKTFTVDTQFIGQMSVNNSSSMLSAGSVISKWFMG